MTVSLHTSLAFIQQSATVLNYYSLSFVHACFSSFLEACVTERNRRYGQNSPPFVSRNGWISLSSIELGLWDMKTLHSTTNRIPRLSKSLTSVNETAIFHYL